MKHVLQPKGSWYCGHCAMAMVLDDNMENLIAGMGEYYPNRGGSTIAMYREELIKRGIAHTVDSKVDNRKAIDLSGKGIVTISGQRGLVHAMAFENGRIYDPEGDVFECVQYMKNYYNRYSNKVRIYGIVRIEEEI